MSSNLSTEQKKGAFEEALLHVLKGWTILTLAVDQGWGGRTSLEKREQLYNDLLQYFFANPSDVFTIGKKRITAKSVIGTDDSLGEWLATELETKFHVDIEDEEEFFEVAHIIRELATTIKGGNLEFYNKIMNISGDGAAKSVAGAQASAYGIAPEQSLYGDSTLHGGDMEEDDSDSDSEYADEAEIIREAEKMM